MDNSDALDYLGIESQSAIFFTKGDDGLILLITLSSLEWCPNRIINMFYMPGVPPRWTIPTPWTPQQVDCAVLSDYNAQRDIKK
jgi:hypothetical protein